MFFNLCKNEMTNNYSNSGRIRRTNFMIQNNETCSNWFFNEDTKFSISILFLLWWLTFQNIFAKICFILKNHHGETCSIFYLLVKKLKLLQYFLTDNIYIIYCSFNGSLKLSFLYLSWSGFLDLSNGVSLDLSPFKFEGLKSPLLSNCSLKSQKVCPK